MLYVIDDGKGHIMRLKTRMWKKSVTVLAIFTDEQEALDLLFEMEKADVLQARHRVTPIEDRIVG